MSLPFERTLRCLERERADHRLLQLLLLAAASGAWGLWMICARVPVYAVSQSGRLEVRAQTHRASSAVPGRVVELSVALGATVLAEQALMRLDDSVERRKLDEATAALDAIGLRRQALHAQLNAEGRVRESQLRSSREALTRAELSVSEATTQVDYHERIGRVAAELHREELISHLDAFKSAQELLASQLHRDAVNADLFKQRADNHYTQQLQAARMVALSRELAELDAAEALAVATVNTARAQIERRVVRAPVAGRIGSVAPLEIGDVVREGEPIATIVPDERLRVVAEFDAADALGRIRPGHVARVRLAGFSIVEFGTLAATVQQVASEAQRGRVRVELALATHLSTDLPLEHGVPGSVEVRVESTAPWRMLLRGMLPSSAGTRSASAEQPPATAAEYSGGAG